VREKPKGNAREMGELSAKREKCDRARAERGARGLPRERENFGKVILGERVLLNKIWVFICLTLL
jgi:hypothetical protein